MRRIVSALTNHFCQPGGTLVDLGCSTGLGIQDFAATCNVVGVEIAESMLEIVRVRYKSFASVRIEALDLRRSFPDVADVDAILAIFTLQFIPAEHRRRVVRRAYQALRPGGALIVAEKCVAETSATQDALVEIYHGFKMSQGYTAEEVDRKALALEGVLVPQTAAGNEAMLGAAGFGDVECCWRWGPFAAWVAVK
jgi:tRNA (cmo5U34)-methyltransferase